MKLTYKKILVIGLILVFSAAMLGACGLPEEDAEEFEQFDDFEDDPFEEPEDDPFEEPELDDEEDDEEENDPF